MGWYLENALGPKSLQGKTVIELGAGVGFGGLIANQLGARAVVITDGNQDVLKLANENIKINVQSDALSTVSTAQLRWGTDDIDSFARDQWDYVLASDVTYRKDSWPILMKTLADLATSKTTVLLSMEPRNVGEVEGVLAQAELHGLQWVEEKLPINPDTEQCSLLCARLFKLSKNPDVMSSYVVSTFIPLVEF